MSTIKTTTLSTQGGSTVPVDTVVNGTAKAWVNFSGKGTVAIRRAFNVSSITDNGVGNYIITFATSMADANYSGVGNGRFEVTGGGHDYGAAIALAELTTSSVKIYTSDGAGPNNAEDENLVMVTIFS